MSPLSDAASAELRPRLKGRVITPGDESYDEARMPFYGGFDRTPALIARVADAADVSTVVRFARESGVELAVRSGGHSVAGHSVSDGIVLDLSEMHVIDVDVVNFLGDEGEARVRQAYPDGTWERLAEVKRRYDPTNLFRLNQNIPPA
jgi:FAD/FMN-containing dehydrogenase